MASEKMVVAQVQAMTREDMEAQANDLLKSGYFPHIKTVAAAVTVIMKGRELGLPPVQALQKLYVVNGQVTCSVEVMLALAARSRVITWDVTKNTDTEAEVVFERWDNPHRQPMTFVSRYTMKDAERAGKAGGDNYRKQPAVMLLRRATGLGLRQIAPDIISGMYVFEEMGIEPDETETFKPRIVNDEIVYDADVDATAPDLDTTDEENAEIVTEADLEEFREFGQRLSTERGIEKTRLNRAVHELLVKLHKKLDALTPAELTLLMQDLEAFDYSTLEGAPS